MQIVTTSGSIYAKEVKGFEDYKYVMPLSATFTVSGPPTEEVLAVTPTCFGASPFVSYEELLDYKLEGTLNISTHSIELKLFLTPSVYCRARQEILLATMELAAYIVANPSKMLEVINEFVRNALGTPL